MKKFPITSDNLSKLVRLEANNDVDHSTAKEVYKEMLQTNNNLELILNRKINSKKNTDDIEDYVISILNNNKKEYKRLLNGETKLINFFIGQAMKNSRGKYKPSDIKDCLIKKFDVWIHN